MKKYAFLFLCLLVFVQNSKSQGNSFSSKKSGSKGKVKQLIVNTYRGDEDVDTLGNPERDTSNFDLTGNQIDEVHYDPNGQLTSKILYTYPDSKTMVQSQYFMGKLFCKYVYKYDDQGNAIEFGTYSADHPELKLSKIEYIVHYNYDDKGNMIEAKTNGTFAKSPNKTTFIYNDAKQVIESDSYLPDGSANEKTTFQYDNFGQEIKTETYKPDGKLYSDRISSYGNYDAMGNWRFKTSLFRSHDEKLRVSLPANITKRQIIYFKLLKLMFL